mmetsp:Transcript_11217/g.21136  ORF Transcript_11217/g.21136 Transcript_11217/m.21136 type:complete len:817 (-) Transcript_11217:276-2726(-)
MGIRIKHGEFVDEHDRVLNLRGINVGGSSKVPSTTTSNNSNDNDDDDNPSHSSSITFVNRPFPLTTAPLHFARLAACGFTIIRFIVTWEAIEHIGPGQYDIEYLTYIRSILEVAAEFDIQVYIDPHQDVWSRWTGGDGAPLWTLEMAGFDVENLRECEAAITMESYGRGYSSAECSGRSRGSSSSSDENENASSSSSDTSISFPKMIWPTNYFKLACATMFTLFWAGERFTPNFMVDDVNASDNGNDDGDDGDGDGDDNNNISDDSSKSNKQINIQTYLQMHYTNAMAELLKHLIGLPNIVGMGTMNEPSPGYINVADLSKGFGQSPAAGPTSTSTGNATTKELKYGLAPTPFQGMCLGEGFQQNVGEWSNGLMQHVLGRADRKVGLDPKGKTAWKECSSGDNGDGDGDGDGGCIWKRAGVWRTNPNTNTPELLFPRYFANVDFGVECYLPFAQRYATTMRRIWSSSSNNALLMFVELPPLEFSSTPFPKISSDSTDDGLSNAVNATHWYDGVTLFTRSWKSYFSYDTRSDSPIFGYKNIFKMHCSQLSDIKKLGVDRMENAPTLIGECGIAYDMRHLDGLQHYGTCRNSKDQKIDSSLFGPQLAAMDHTLRCLEENLLSFTLWNYTSDNTNKGGDSWNGEDLSIYSEEQKRGDLKDEEVHGDGESFIYDGLRAARAFVRPYARCVAGKVMVNKFDMQKGVFLFKGKSSSSSELKYDVPTEIFVPKLWCLKESDMSIKVSPEGSRFEVDEFDHWFIVKYWHSSDSSSRDHQQHMVEIRGPGMKTPSQSPQSRILPRSLSLPAVTMTTPSIPFFAKR